MSYILDALKKADAEHERGSVPGLHSQPLGQVDDDEDTASRRPVPPAMWLVAGAGICLIAVLSWQLLSRPAVPTPEPAPEPAVAPMATTAPPPDQHTQPARADSMPAAVEQRAPQAPLAVTPPQAPAERPPAVAQHAPPPAPAMPPATPPAAVVREAHARATAQATQTVPKPATQAAPPATRVPTMSELPDDIKRDLPQLMIGGAMYSDTPSSRMLIINSQVFHEGDQPYQGLVLEEIRLKSAVFKYRGYRYAINY